MSIRAFPYIFATSAYLFATYYHGALSLRTPVHFIFPPIEIYIWLLLFVLIALIWLFIEFVFAANRETVTSDLQVDVMISCLNAIIFTGVAGWFIGTASLEWWFIIPWVMTVVDALMGAWLGVNNAAQKPFASAKGKS